MAVDDAEVKQFDYPEADYSSKVLRGCYTHPSQLLEEAKLRDACNTDYDRRFAAALRAEARRWETELL